MNIAFICIFIVFIVHIHGSRAANYEEFQPRPIPINDWDSGQSQEKVSGAGSLHEAISLGAPKTVAVVPAHYWEDALRHSVYLTLVRDKIDQLIAQGLVVAPDSKPDVHTSKDVDDHNLWEKIKTAPFDRLTSEEPPMAYGDITILAKGRLLEDNDGYRFTQDNISKEKCNEDSCMDGIRAYWSVKRVRQRDTEINPGKYHYELTFSVMSHNLKKEKKPYENPIRTFTVRESNAAEETKPQVTEPTKYVQRPQRAVWYHKNINPQFNYHSRKTYQPPILDRLFLSLFGDEEPEVHYQPRYKPAHQPPTIQSTRVGQGAPVEHQKKIGPYRYAKPHHTRYNNRVPPPLALNFPPTPPLSQPPLQHELTEFDKYTINGSPVVKTPTSIKLLSEFDNKYAQNSEKQFSELDNQYTQPSEQKQTTEIGNKYTQKQDQTPTTSEVTDKLILQPDEKQTSDFDNKYTLQPGHKHSTDYGNKYTQKDQKYSNEHDKFTRQSEQKHIGEFDKRYHHSTDHKHFSEFDTKHTRQPDMKYFSTKIVKGTKPIMPPTPPVQYPYVNVTMPTQVYKPNLTEPTTREPEIITYNMKTKPKHQMTKFSPFSDHIRPPVFNAPPGVFVTMDKKPFKPMPPLKLPFLSKHMSSKKPIDFRPSPQVLDVQFSEPDPLSDSFRPITINYADSNTTQFSDLAAPVTNHTKTKSKKKHENIKSHRTTTTQAPDIITAQNNFSIEKMTLESMNWATNMLGTYSKTTPMLSEILEEINDTTTESSAITSTTDASWLLATETKPEPTTTTSTTTTGAPKKRRTRPPAKFGSADKTPHAKVRKHKRVTTPATANITSTTPSTTTTVKPQARRTLPDLFSQTTNRVNQVEELEQNDTITSTTSSSQTSTKVTTTTSTSTTTTTTPRPVTTRTTRTTTTTPTTTTPAPTTTQHKNNNRYRVSTLMYKGTSVKHDKWTASNSNIDKSKTVIPLSKTQQARRKASNFHGYVSSTPKTIEEERPKEDHADHFPDSYYNEMSIQPLSEKTPTNVESPPQNTEETQPQYNDVREQEGFYDNDMIPDSKDQNEYIFSVSNTNSNDGDLSDPELITVTEISVTTSPLSSSTNKTKCKKKKTNTTTTETLSKLETEVLLNSTDAPAVSDIFDEIFGFTANDDTDTYNINNSSEPIGESSNNENYYSPQGDLEDFLKSLTATDVDMKPELYQDDDEEEIEIDRIEKDNTSSDESEEDEDYSNAEDESRTSRHPDVLEEPREQPYSFLELMAMD